jgi:surface antigen
VSSSKCFARVVRSARVVRGSLALTGALGLSLVATQLASPSTAQASSGLHYQRGYYVTSGWLCYGWSSGIYHCTRHWHRTSSGHLVSDNPGWVPNVGSGTSTSRSPSHTASHTTSTSAGKAPSGIGQWVKPAGYHSYAMHRTGQYNNLFGYCTWYAWYRHLNEPLMQLGNAAQWAHNAPRHGLRTGTTPRAGATVVFQPGVQGASSLGHVGHVEKVYSNGWFLISEMSFYWNGGGWGRVSYRYAHVGRGVSFIY